MQRGREPNWSADSPFRFFLMLGLLVLATASVGFAQTCDAATNQPPVVDDELSSDALPQGSATGTDSQAHLHPLDWLIIFCYAATMIGIGWYYNLRTKDTEDYLLGGRVMKPWMVGLSLFATLVSTLSYLSYPGEMIRYGPVMFGGLAAIPLVFLIVGWLLIPAIMHLKVTSGYEILEIRLGLGCRLVGSLLFLALRLMWMATIIYTTVDKVLVPIMAIDPAYTPLVSTTIGVVTLAYTSMGGIRAVVLTDVIQTLILFGGALATIVLITVHFGGVGGWWPHHWPRHWVPPRWDLSFEDGRTIGNAMISFFAWYICTAGSDQMAIQRYLSTRDAAAARRSFGINMIATFLVKVVLALVGVAVMGYFLHESQTLPAGETITSHPDRLFSRYIVLGLPPGMSGLVAAGMMAAAMSSLSSGVNSSASVISEDFFQRLGWARQDEAAHVRRARWISVVVGAIAVLGSFGVAQVGGNLYEVVYKMCNTLVAPLFILFLMAMFVPWATTFGTLVGLAAGLATAYEISFGEHFGIPVFWNIPASLVVGAVVGMLASLLPIGPSAADLKRLRE